MRVTALKSGRSLLDYVDANGMPDLVLLDIKMPEMDGFETLLKLRELEQASPAIAVNCGAGTFGLLYMEK